MIRPAVIFPGQGSQVVGMAQELCNVSACAADVVQAADEALGFSLSKIMWEGPGETLQLTEHAQPALLTAGVAAWRALSDTCGVQPLVAAGHSLGEYTALVATGALSFADAVRAVHTRGRLMQTAVPVGQGTMAAVVGLDGAKVAEMISKLANGPDVVAVAGFNTPDQTTISGSVAGVDKASKLLKEAGARRVLPLKVSAPFHSPLMQPVGTPLREQLQTSQFTKPAFPVVTNVEAIPNEDPASILDLLIRQLVAPVRWVESVQTIVGLGVTHFVELGPGKVLSGMIRKTRRDAVCLAVSDAESLKAAAAALTVP